MILVDWQIEQCIKNGIIKISPYDKNLIQPNSIDVRIGDTFILMKEVNEIDPYEKESVVNSCELIKLDENEYFVLNPNDFVLGRTVEYITLPDNIVASLEGKSSIARLGIDIHKTAGWIDAGFTGTLTLEIGNVNKSPIRIYPNMTIGQLVFHKTAPVKVSYLNKKDAKYNGQIDPVVSQYFRN